MDFKILYGKHADEKNITERIDKLKKRFYDGEKRKSEYLFSSSGRAEILGNHTDHNFGKVIVAAITCDVLAAVDKRSDNTIKICSEGYEDILIDCNDTEINKNEFGTSKALTRGVVAGIKEKGYSFNGFTAYITSNVFKGAGVSSSAAFELLICEIINSLYLDGALNGVEKAVISQYSENAYFGKPCGLLDQTGISLGSLNMLDFKTPTKPEIQTLNPPDGYTLVITNTGGDHSNLTEHYAAIKDEMFAIAGYFDKKVLREVDSDKFFAAIPELRKKFSERAILRAIHFYNENERVERAEEALKRGDIKEFLHNITESGDSSMYCLQNCFVPGETVQPIPLAIALSKKIIKNGAVRVHGGGFAGTILAYISEDETENYVAEMSKVFGSENVFTASVRKVGACRIE